MIRVQRLRQQLITLVERLPVVSELKQIPTYRMRALEQGPPRLRREVKVDTLQMIDRRKFNIRNIFTILPATRGTFRRVK